MTLTHFDIIIVPIVLNYYNATIRMSENTSYVFNITVYMRQLQNKHIFYQCVCTDI